MNSILHCIKRKGFDIIPKSVLVDETLGKARTEASSSIDTKCCATIVKQQPMCIFIYLLFSFLGRESNYIPCIFN